ncbi:MAG TPA: CDP-glycerol glycerophosphotransferase family protein [Jatrophihabitantaceae bacterium]
MSKFRFEAGNLRALRNLPLYALSALVALVVPRSRRVWVFGCGIGLGEGALPLIRRAADRLPDVRLYWLATTDSELAEARALGLDAIPKDSARGLWLTLRAKVVVVTHGVGDVNRFGARGGFVVQLWHGIPLKRLHLDTAVALRVPFLPSAVGRPLMRLLYRLAGRQLQLFPVASERIVGRIASAFGIPRDRIAVTGDPRDDVLFRVDREDAREHLTALIGDVPDTVVLYAPTWRDGADDPTAPDTEAWQAIHGWLERNDALLVVRAHPHARGDHSGGVHERVRLLDSTMLRDVNAVLPGIDGVVTDYSSIAFDFALTGGPTVFLAPDVTAYTHSRGLYDPYRTFSGGRDVVSWPHALDQLDEALRPGSDARQHSAWLRSEYFDWADGDATDRVLDEILCRTGQAVTSAPLPSEVRPVVSALRGDATRLQLEIEPPPNEATLIGPRSSVAGVIDAGTVTFPLLVNRWGSSGLALPSGDYRLDLDGSTRVRLTAPPVDELHERFRLRAGLVDGGLVVRVGPPLRPGENVSRPGTRQALDYLRPHRREHAVWFESFYGRTAADNPLGIDRALARIRPEVRRYWSVADCSVAVPDGSVRVVEGSAEWWRSRADARVLVANDWLRWLFRPRRGQHVLQTWHGTMLKALGLDRPDMSARRRFAIKRQGWRWNALLAQNYYSERIFRSSYGYRGPIWEDGYPRNDVFTDMDRAPQVRRAVGVPADARVVLYAPTWRDDRNEMVDYVDLVRFADELPDDTVFLVRGHSRTLAFGRDLRAERLVDVTTYPDAADLMLIADVLVTDYSSVMFDFAATNKPLIFFTPDLTHYEDELRGFYFDLIAEAPGPVTTTREELLDAIRTAEADAEKFAARRALWHEKFAPHDDGRAGERVVRRMEQLGWL